MPLGEVDVPSPVPERLGTFQADRVRDGDHTDDREVGFGVRSRLSPLEVIDPRREPLDVRFERGNEGEEVAHSAPCMGTAVWRFAQR